MEFTTGKFFFGEFLVTKKVMFNRFVETVYNASAGYISATYFFVRRFFIEQLTFLFVVN